MESPNLIIPAVFISAGHSEWKHPRNAVLLSLYIAHYINRCVACLLVAFVQLEY